MGISHTDTVGWGGISSARDIVGMILIIAKNKNDTFNSPSIRSIKYIAHLRGASSLLRSSHD